MKMCSLSRLWYGSVVAALIGVIVWLIPSPIDPPNTKLSEHCPGFEGALEQNSIILTRGRRIYQGQVSGPESFALDADNALYTGLGDGRVVRLVEGTVENVTRLGKGGYSSLCGDPATRHECGRPLGMHFQPSGLLYVMDSFHGLYSVDVHSHQTHLLWDMAGDVIRGNPVGFPNDFAVLDNGSILLTDSSERCRRMSFVMSFFEFRSEGKVVLYNPGSREAHVLLSNLTFPNGVLLSEDGTFVYIAEMGAVRILRYYLKGAKAGTHDVLISDLPGLPDNLSFSSRGTLWVPLSAVRKVGSIDFFLENGWLRSLICKVGAQLLEALLKMTPGYGLILEVDKSGRIVRSYHDPSGGVVSEASEVVELGTSIIIGSYKADYLVQVDLEGLLT